MTTYDIPFIVIQSLPNALTPKNTNSRFLVTGIWQFNTDIFIDEDFLPFAVTDSPLQDNKNFENFRLSDSRTSNSNLGVNSQHSTSRLNTGHSSSERNLCHENAVEIRSFPKAAAEGRLARGKER
jgi:hypothetical protein